jgi:hypothetical protein
MAAAWGSGAQGVWGMIESKPRQLLSILSAAAAAGEQCPSNEALQIALGGISRTHVTRLFAGLEGKRLISADRRVRPRIITITATGKSTVRASYQPRKPYTQAYLREAGEKRAVELIAERSEIERRRATDRLQRDAERERWLTIEQEKYGLPKRARLIDGMGA